MVLPDLLLAWSLCGLREERERSQAQLVLDDLCADTAFVPGVPFWAAGFDRRMRSGGSSVKRGLDRSLPSFSIDSDHALIELEPEADAFELRPWRTRRC